MTSRQKRIIFIVSASVLLIILAVGVILIKLNAVTDTERAKAFLQTMYTVTAEESSELLICIISGSLTAEMTE